MYKQCSSSSLSWNISMEVQIETYSGPLRGIRSTQSCGSLRVLKGPCRLSRGDLKERADRERTEPNGAGHTARKVGGLQADLCLRRLCRRSQPLDEGDR